jgi:hypothetical protein
MYIRLKIKPSSVRIIFLSCQIVFLSSRVFEVTPLLHCSTNLLALCQALCEFVIIQYNILEKFLS